MLYDAMIIGGGAAGLMAACALSRMGRRVVVLEKQARVGRKLLSTGNGRCNLTNRNARPSDYHGARQAAQQALKAWPPKRVEAEFGRLGIPCVADEAGRVYPMSRQAASVLDALRLSCDEAGVRTLTGFCVTSLAREGEAYLARSGDGGEADLNYEADDNVVACYHLTKGLEFDAVIAVWPDAELTEGERRRLYTACSRALHSLALLGGGKLIRELGLKSGS